MWASSSYFEGGYVAGTCGYQVRGVNPGYGGVIATSYPVVDPYSHVTAMDRHLRERMYEIISEPVDLETNWTYEEVNTASKPPERNPNGYRQRKLKARLNNLPKD